MDPKLPERRVLLRGRGVPKSIIHGKSLVEVQEKEWIECPLDDLGYFGIQISKWENVAQDEGE